MAVNDQQSAISSDAGGVVALLVHPEFRGQGIGGELVRRSVAYLEEHGVHSIEFGATDQTNGFYIGMYGGARPIGFRQSDGSLTEFAQKMNWEPASEFRCLQKNLEGSRRDPVSAKLIANRRKTQLEAVDASTDASWWWMTRLGRMDSVQFNLVDKNTRESFASCEIFGLDLYIPKWGQRAAGLGAVTVSPEHAGKEYELTLLLEVSKYLREQLITIIDTSVDVTDEGNVRLLDAAGFTECDRAVVFRSQDSSRQASDS